MPVNRQQPFQVVPQSGVTAADYNGASDAGSVARQLSNLLSTATNTTVSVLGKAEEQSQIDTRDMLAMANLAEATKKLENDRELFSVEAATQATQQAAAKVNEDMQLANMRLREIIDQRERGIVALVANSTPDQLAALIQSGQAQGLDPKGFLKLEERIGQRMATEDTVAALKLIHQSPNTPPDQVFSTLMAGRLLNSDIAKASYLSTLTNDVARYRNGEILNLVEAERQKSSENEYIRLQRNISFDARDGSLTSEKFSARIKEFQDNYRELNPRASDLDVFTQTAKALSGVIGSGELAKLSPGRLVPLATGLSELTKNEPMYGPLYVSVVNDIKEQINKQQSIRVDTIESVINNASGQTGLLTAGAFIQTAVNSGELSIENAASLATKLNQRKESMSNQLRAESRIFRLPDAATTALPETVEQDTAIDAAVSKYVAANPYTDGQGNMRPWKLSEVAQLTYERTGRVTKGLLDRLNTMASIPLGQSASPEAMQGYADAAETVQALSSVAPLYTRDLVRSGKLDTRLGLLATLHRDAPGFSFTGTAQRLASIDDSNILEAQAILSGQTSYVRRAFNQTTGEQKAVGETSTVSGLIKDVADLDSIVKDSLDGYFTWRADYGSTRAQDAFRAMYTYNYALLRQQGKSVPEAHEIAKTRSKSEIEKNFRTYDLGQGRERYIVPPDFPVIAGIQQPQVAEKAMMDFGAFWRSAQRETFNALVNENKAKKNLFFRDTFSQLSLNMDDAVIEGVGEDKVLLVPLRLDGVDMDRTKGTAFLRFPLDPVKQKASVEEARKKNRAAQPYVPSDMPSFGGDRND